MWTPSPTGRDALLAALRDGLAAPGRVLLSGPAGIGKSALLEELATEGHAQGHTVLRSAPVEQDRDLPFVTLVDLLAEVGDDTFALLANPQRSAVEQALSQGTPPPPGSAQRLALRLGVLRVLSAVAGDDGALLVLDNAQWADPESVDVLAFALRRSAATTLRAVIAQRDPAAGVLRAAAGAVEHTVTPLDIGELAELLRRRLGREYPFPVLARIHRDCGGNPTLAIQLATALSDDVGAPAIPAATLLHDAVAALSPGARSTLLLAVLADRPTLRLLRGCRVTADAEVREAARLGLVTTLPGGSLLPASTLLREILLAESTSDEQRAAHRLLAELSADPAVRLLHHASSTMDTSADLAAELDAAAAAARGRGDSVLAADLSELAAGRTPLPHGSAHADRLVAAADSSAEAGDAQRVRRLADEVLAATGAPGQRVRARLAVIHSCGQALRAVQEEAAHALTDAGADDRLLGLVHRQLINIGAITGSADSALEAADLAAAHARAAGDPVTEATALGWQARLRRVLGDPAAEDTLARALAVPVPPGSIRQHDGPRFVAARHAMFDDRLAESRSILLPLLAEAERGGGTEAMITVLRAVAEVEARWGRCAEALRHARRALRLTERTGLSAGPSWYTMATAELAGGSVARASGFAELGTRASRSDNDEIFLSRNLHVLGIARLADGDAGGAVAALTAVGDLEAKQGVRDPSVLRWHGDLIESLAAARRLPEAYRVHAEAREQAARLGRRGVLAALDRALALCQAADGDLGAAAESLDRALATLDDLDLPLERGRTLVVLGSVRRRRRHTAAARATIAEARDLFERCGSPVGLALADRELDRLDRGRGQPGVSALTPMEDRVARLAGAGMTNREIAAGMFISVKTVEGTLTRVYQKLGVHRRTALVTLLPPAGH